ncbi:hypothetical protein EW026_g3605 [Hermanssonia centrifuga]|uniref:DNA damage-binding protein 1 n=1 Tax=Hermanssonia centrifuga TaxID=98765 RepID=A0A4S4KJL5_9APHY|nr:hypothetical protein EW026_g3605 [Hermanssonia centrifuga]
MQRVQLLARDINLKSQDLSISYSLFLSNTILPASAFPDTENQPMLIPIPPFALAPEDEDEGEKHCIGGVLVAGGRKILFYELTSKETRKRQKDKDKRQTKRKASSAKEDTELAREKEKEKDAKKLKARASVKWPWSEVTAWCPADDEMRRFFISDMYGRLAMLVVGEAPDLMLIPLGETSTPTTLSYLSSQVLYVGSHTGDAQLIRIHATAQTNLDTDTLPISNGFQTILPTELARQVQRREPQGEDYEMHDNAEQKEKEREIRNGRIINGKGSYVEVLDSYRNLAPILDAVSADTDDSGQPQIVTCSGGANTGSLNIVRTGADFQELAVLRDIHSVMNIWPIRSSFESSTDSHILVSTLQGTLLFRIDGRETFTHLDASLAGFLTDTPTLASANIAKRVTVNNKSTYIDSHFVVQVTSTCVTLIEYDSALQVFDRTRETWVPEQHNPLWKSKEIVAASLNSSQFLVALSGGTIVLLNLNETGKFQFLNSYDFHGMEVSTVSCAPFDRSKHFSVYAAAAFWDPNIVRILSLKDRTLNTICEVTLPSVARSLLLHNFGTGHKSDTDYHPYVVAGLIDGTVACLRFQNNEMLDKKIFPLGTAPVSLAACTVDQKPVVLAVGSRSSILDWERQRPHQSSVMVKNLVAGSWLNATDFPGCQILATPSSLIIGQIKGVGKMQIRSIPLGYDNPRRITYHPDHKVFGVVCQRREASRVGDSEIIHSSFVVFDDTTFEPVHALKRTDYIAVGTMRYHHGESEPSSGRILLFSLKSVHTGGGSNTIDIVATQEAEGCVFGLTDMNGQIAAAVNSSVDLYSIVEEEIPGNTAQDAKFALRLTRTARWNHNYLINNIVAYGQSLITSDAISSVSVLRVVGTDLQTVARDYGPLNPIAVEAARNNGVIGANMACNLFTFSIQQRQDRNVLERDGHYHVGDVVTKFVPGELNTQDAHESRYFEPEQLFFTSSGCIGLVFHIADEAVSLHLTALQNNMAETILGPGEIRHNQWRTPANSRGRSDADQAIGFLDGDFLEQFLTHPHAAQLLEGNNPAKRVALSQHEAEGIVEKLQSRH